MLAALSWLAVILGFAGTWLAGKHRSGWLVGVACCAVWSVYDIARGIWAGLFAVIVGAGLSIRNYHVGGRYERTSCSVTAANATSHTQSNTYTTSDTNSPTLEKL